MESLMPSPPPEIRRPEAFRRVKPGCPACGFELDPAAMLAGEQTCPVCHVEFLAMPFSPPEVPVRVRSLAEAGPGEAAPCGLHAGNAAIGSCDRCGIFICDLCGTDIDGRRLCPGCFDRLTAEGTLTTSRKPLRDYRGLARFVGIVGLFLSCFGLLTGPLTIWLALRARQQKKLLDETGGGGTIVVAILLGILQIVLGLLVPIRMFTSLK
jgi:hypothetical protein